MHASLPYKFYSISTESNNSKFHSLQLYSMDSSTSSSSSSLFVGSKILVGVSLDAQASSELLSWAVGVVARANDTIIALHILVGKDENYDMKRLSRAKAFVISVLGEFAEICQTKQVKLEAKVKSSTSIGRGLTHEAALLNANFLLVDGQKKPSQR